jgi:LacI family transcriptional regulator
VSKALTARELAKLAGVSVATVSRVSRGIGQVSPETRRRVLAAIEAHGYRPSHLGRALAERRHGSLGLVFPGLSGPYYAELIQGFESEAVKARASVHILCTHLRDDSDEQVLEMAYRADGIAVLGGTVSDATLEQLKEMAPVVLLAADPAPGVHTVTVDNAAAMESLTAHLLDTHRARTFAFVGDPTGSPDVTGRWTGFRRALESAGLTPPRTPVRVALQQHDGVVAADRLLARAALPDAIVCANDELALGVLIRLLSRGVDVPGDVAVTGFDDAPMAELVRPTLTTVRQPVRELAATTARTLLDLVDREGGDQAASTTVLSTEVVVRRSCGCRPRKREA